MMFRLFTVLLLATGVLGAQDGYRITVEIDDYDADILTLGYYLLDNQYIIDTASRTDEGRFVFASDTAALEPGMYIVVLSPENEFFQFLIDGEEEQTFTLRTRAGALDEMEIEGSAQNQLFYDYLAYIAEMQAVSAPVRAMLSDSTLAPADSAQVALQMEAIDEEVKKAQQKLIDTHPESFTAAIIRSNRAAIPPEYTEMADPDDRRNAQWRWLQAHYLDNLDLSDRRLLRTPFLFQRVDYYVNQLQLRHPDTLARAIDRVLERFDPESEGFKYYLVHYTNDAATSKVVGMDAVYVHLVDKYYRNGMAYWTEEEQLAKMLKNTDDLRPLLIGKQAPDLKMTTRAGEAITLYDVEAEYTVLYFWRYDCPACKKSTPHMKSFYENWKDRGVKVFSVCTKGEDEIGECWDYVDEQGTGDWIQAVDPYQRYYRDYDIKSTPSIFLLDRDKKIVSKRIGAEQLDEVLSALTKESATAAGK